MAGERPPAGLERHGWRLHAHPLFLDQLERLLAVVERAKRSDPEGWTGKADIRLLVALRLVPGEVRGNRFRLFFRADSRAKVIVYASINDRDTLRKAGASSDPYAASAAMLAGGNPPDDWPALLATAQADEAVQRFRTVKNEAE